MRSLKRILLSIAVLLPPVGLLAVGSGGQVSSGNQHRGIHYMRGAGPTAATNPQNVEYHGGPVLTTSTTYAIWWGKPSDFSPGEREEIDDFLQGLDGSAYLDIADQYLFGKPARAHFGSNLFDGSAPPSQDPPTTEIVAEVYKVLTNNGLKPSPTAIYMVYSSNFPPQNLYCAYHDFAPGPDGTNIHVVFVPNAAAPSAPPGACYVAPPDLSCNNRPVGTQAAANSSAHEIMESITDPNNDAWYNVEFNNEIGDLGNFTYKRCVNLTNGVWQLQEIWSNQVGHLVQGAGSPED
jgi:hypothetical protein